MRKGSMYIIYLFNFETVYLVTCLTNDI